MMTIDTTDDPLAATPEILPDHLAWLEARYLRNARDDEVHDYLQEILEVGSDGTILPRPARDPLTGETAGLMVPGESGYGKSGMLVRNLKALAGFEAMTERACDTYIQCTVPPEATIRSLGETIAAATGYRGFSSKARAYDVWEVARHRMTAQGVGLLVIDEAHHVLRRDAPAGLQSLKGLMQGRQAVAVILSGVPKLGEIVMQDAEIDRRFIRLHLRRTAEDGEDAAGLEQFIDVCRDRLGLPIPEDRTLAARIVFANHGGLGVSVNLAKAIIRRARIDPKCPGMTLAHAARTFDMRGRSNGPGPFERGDWEKVRAGPVDRGWS